jgi:hypothetical protein
MKREKISLFILVVEIVLITYLHSAKNLKTEGGKQVVKKGAVTPSRASISFISFK